MLFANLSSNSFYIAFFLNIIYYLISFFTPKNKKFQTNLSFGLVINLLIIFSFILFILAFVYSDFSLYTVFANSHRSKPLIYKIGAAWSSNEGSMLFWLTIMAVYNIIHILSDKKDTLSHHIQSFIQLVLHGFIIISANPFQKLYPIPLEGNGFNPLLQDYSLLIHPPILYLGYAGSSISFAKILSLSIRQDWNSWNKIKSWVIIPWFFLTLGIALGSLWSYRELGWGGFWAWDPVENVSLLPWFASLSFIHLLLIKNKNYLINYLLKINGILIFIFSLFATFIVRSGLITSIHSFAKNEENGLYFLFLLGFFTIFGFFVITKYDQNSSKTELKRQEKIILYGTYLLSLCYLTIVFAIVTPIYLNLYHNQIVNIGESFYQKIFGVIFIPILSLVLYLPLKNSIFKEKKYIIFLLSIFLLAFYLLNLKNIPIIAIINLILSILIISSYSTTVINDVILKKKINYPSLLSHIGISIMILGSIIATINNQSAEKFMNIDKENKITINQYTAELKSINILENSDFTGIKANFNLWYKNSEIGQSHPELKFYKIEKMQLPDSSSFYHRLSDIYILITGVDAETNKISVKIFYKKFVALVWIGLSMIITGGFLSIILNQMKKH